MSGLDPRLSGALTAHSSIVSALSVAHSLRTRGLRHTLLLAALGTSIPLLGELLAVNVLKVLRHHLRPQAGGVPLAIALGWYNVGYGTLAMIEDITPGAGDSRASVAAAAATSLDLLLDPCGLDLGLWEWRDGGPYAAEVEGPNGRRGVPLLNFGGWIASTAGVTLAYRRIGAGRDATGRPGAGRAAALVLLSYYLPAAAWALRRKRRRYLLYSAPFATMLWAALRGRPHDS